MKSELLATALRLAPAHGWSVGALHAAARAHGLPPTAGALLFSKDDGGALALVRHFQRDLDARTQAHLAQESSNRLLPDPKR